MARDDHLLRARRWADFRRRAEYAPGTVYRHRTRGWEYIPVHPFSDESEVLGRLDLRPVECVRVDAWWGIDGDATLLESMVAGESERPPGLYAKLMAHEEGWVYLVAVFDAPQISRAMFEEAMERFAEGGFPGDNRLLGAGDSWLLVCK